MISDTHRRNLSEAMKRSHALGRHPGWKHINSQQDRLSYPERFLKTVLSNEGLLSRFTVVPHLSVGKFFLDFAILELKLDIEIDGVQHHRDAKAIQHDKNRDAYLRDNGWTVYRISWLQMMKDSKKEIDELLAFISNFESGLDRYYEVPLQTEARHLPAGVKIKQLTDKKWEPYKQVVAESGIDFSKFGWVGKVSTILNIKPQKVGQWMIRYLPDIYETAFRRK